MVTNDTLRFVLPIFYDASSELDANFFINEFTVGVFSSDMEHPENDDRLHLIYNYFPSEKFVRFEDKLKALLNPMVYEDKESDTFVYVVDIPEDYQDDYTLITAGAFNKISPVLKLKIIKMWGLTEKDELFKVLVGTKEYEGEPFESEIYNLNTEENVTEIL